jgi:hypothetical protein
MVFGSYWVVLEPNFLEEVGGEKLTSQLYNQGLSEAKGKLLGAFRAELC